VQVLHELRRLCVATLNGPVTGRVEARSARARRIAGTMYARLQQDLQTRWWGQKPTSTARLAAEIW